MLDDLVALRLLLEWGADEAIEAEPLDRLRPNGGQAAVSAAAGQGPASPALPTRSHAGPGPLSGGVMPAGVMSGGAAAPRGTPGERALAAAGGAATLDELRAALAAFDGCGLRDTASNLVFAEGDPDADVMLIGDPPGREEDRGGHPFAGAEGQLLDQMLASIGLARETLLLTHLLPWRPPGGRPPHPAELALCLPFLHRLLVLTHPRYVLLLGGSASRALLDRGVARRRGVKDWVDVAVPGMARPARGAALPSLGDLLRTPNLKRAAWAGLRLLRRTLDSDLT